MVLEGGYPGAPSDLRPPLWQILATCLAKKEGKVSKWWRRRVKHWIWWRPGRNAAAVAEGAVEGMANIGKILRHNKGWERVQD